ncbi:MAG: hypothetical protein JSS09_04295 [Verrucomicrobia bacterium]|nr:hypothetical protein [Verrucomicrobiota bacterium]
MDLTIEDYTDKSIVVRGETKPHRDELVRLGGKWNTSLRGGAGWIFPKTKEADVALFISGDEAKSTKSAPVVQPNSDLTSQIEQHVRKLSAEQRLTFLQKVVQLCVGVVDKPKPPPVVTKTVGSASDKSRKFLGQTKNDSSEEDEEEEELEPTPMKRLVY